MHILEAYALSSGAKIDKCFISEEYIQIPDNPYITLHSYNPKGSGRQYRYWNDVISILNSNKNFTHEIIQIGGLDDIKERVNTSYLGKTNYNSLAYLIKHCGLHLGFDSLPVHLASHYGKKMVVLYAHYVNNTKPYFSCEQDIRLLGPKLENYKPVFSQEDPLSLINTIKPEDIASSVMELL